MNKHELRMQIYDMERGIPEICLILSFVGLTFIPRTVVMMACPEGFTFEAAIVS